MVGHVTLWRHLFFWNKMTERTHEEVIHIEESIDLLLWPTVTATWTLMKLFLIYVRTSLSHCWALPVLFSTKKAQIPTRILTLTNIRIANLPRPIDKKNLVRHIQLIIFVILFAEMYYMILLLLHFADTSWTSGKWKEIGSCRQGVQDKSALRQIGTSIKRQIGTWTNRHLD